MGMANTTLPMSIGLEQAVLVTSRQTSKVLHVDVE